MKPAGYLFDTHALIFWSNKSVASNQFIHFFDEQDRQGVLYVSSISFWEIALLVQKGRVTLPNVHGWQDELFRRTNVRLLEPSITEMIDSTLLPLHHKDPFDRILIAQAVQHDLILVTQDQMIQQYNIRHIWL